MAYAPRPSAKEIFGSSDEDDDEDDEDERSDDDAAATVQRQQSLRQATEPASDDVTTAMILGLERAFAAAQHESEEEPLAGYAAAAAAAEVDTPAAAAVIRVSDGPHEPRSSRDSRACRHAQRRETLAEAQLREEEGRLARRRAALDDHIRRCGHRLMGSIANGHCADHSVGYACGYLAALGDRRAFASLEAMVAALRRRAVDFIRERRGYFEGFLSGETFDEFVDKLLSDDEAARYGDQHLLAAYASLYGVEIKVLKFTVSGNSNSPAVRLDAQENLHAVPIEAVEPRGTIYLVLTEDVKHRRALVHFDLSLDETVARLRGDAGLCTAETRQCPTTTASAQYSWPRQVRATAGRAQHSPTSNPATRTWCAEGGFSCKRTLQQ